jgi:histidine triad (HIT) family protein
MSCIFCRIVAGELPSKKVWENEHVLAFHDIRPAAPVHVLVVPKRHVDSAWELDDRALAGELFFAAAEVARELALDAGFRLIVNTRHDGGQEVGHLHVHVVGGKRLGPMLSR